MAKITDLYRRVSKSESKEKHQARRYVNKETGEEISRWQYQSLASGGIDPKEKAKIRKKSQVKNKLSQYSILVKQYKQKTAKKLGIRERDVKVRGSSPTAKHFREHVKKLNKLTEAELNDKSYNGKLSQILIELNLREAEWGLNVGEYPQEVTADYK